MKKTKYKVYQVIVPLLLGLFLTATVAESKPDHLTMVLPAQTLREIIIQTLPINFKPQGNSFNGTLSLVAVNDIAIHNQTISTSGIISGKDMAMDMNFGGKNIKLNLGEMRTPFTCDLKLRFDSRRQQLFVTPIFRQSNPNDPQSQTVAEIINSFTGKEYPVDLNQALAFTPMPEFSKRKVKLRVSGVDGQNNQLVINLQPAKQ